MPKDCELKSGLRVGNYVLSELIGRGAFGEVWKAAHFETPHRIRAVKIATNAAFRHQLSREGSLPDIDHPNVVRILDSDTRVSEIPYLVMQYVAGGNLADLLRANPSGLPEERVGALLKDILAGLGAAHERGIIHRDIKPQNILLAEDGRALLTDFGLSCGEPLPDAMRSVMQSTSLALDQGQTLAGTLAYMAPEVLEGQTPTPAADVYSVGVLLFEMLAGRRPGGVEMPSQARANLREPGAWDRLYAKACCPLSARFADAGSVLEAFLREASTWSLHVAVDHVGAASVADELRRVVRVALADGRISTVETKELQQLAEQVGATAEQLACVVEEVDADRRARYVAPISEDDILTVLRGFLPDKRIHVTPEIPDPALQNARTCCSIPASEPVLGLVDCTVFRSAKECVVFPPGDSITTTPLPRAPLASDASIAVS